MKCVQCDICNKYVNVWKEVDFTYWQDRFTSIPVKDICSECEEEICQKIKEMTNR